MRNIKILNARQNNLKSVNVEIPRNQVVVFTGVSGSGKSSLVFETIHAEAQRQLYDTFGTYAQGHLPKVSRPECDLIENISPSIVIKQKRSAGNSKSTVGTMTEIYTYLRLLFSRIGIPSIGSSTCFSFNSPEGMCTACNGTGRTMEIDHNKIFDFSKSLNEGAILFPYYKVGTWPWKCIANTGYFDKDLPLDQYPEETMDKLLHYEESDVEYGLGGLGITFKYEGVIAAIRRLYVNKNPETLSKQKKQVIEKFLKVQDCRDCKGSRLNQRALGVKINGYNIDVVSHLGIERLSDFISEIEDERAEAIIGQIKDKAQQLIDIGLGYLSLSRQTSTLSGGESQRVKLAKQLGSNLTEMMYILDEPSVGLHPRDVHQLNALLRTLRDRGNTVLVVEHDPDVIEIADHIIDMGPLAGTNGGEVVFQGQYQDLLHSGSLTGQFLNQVVEVKSEVRSPEGFFAIQGATTNNLKNLSVEIPKGVLTCITGVAGSGKSTLIHEEFLRCHPEAIVVDQSAIGQSERSNAATYTGLFDDIRKEFSRKSGAKASLFSFNSDGACPKCNGLGFIDMEMAFLDPVRTVCEECDGKRYKESTLKYRYKGYSIADILELSIDQAAGVFEQDKIVKKLRLLQEVGLGYLTLGQPLSSLSGGECQRVKLASELHKSGNTYILDEPTTGLHMSDTQKIVEILDSLADNGNTVLVIEHNLDVIARADWVIDIGPDGGVNGGEVVYEGTPQSLMKAGSSHTGRHLARYALKTLSGKA